MAEQENNIDSVRVKKIILFAHLSQMVINANQKAKVA
jgi:hypothetical protein